MINIICFAKITFIIMLQKLVLLMLNNNCYEKLFIIWLNAFFFAWNSFNWINYSFGLCKGRPLSVVHWYRNSHIIDDTYSQINSTLNTVIVRNELFIKNISRIDLNSQIICQSSNNNLTQPQHFHLSIDVNCEYLVLHSISNFLIQWIDQICDKFHKIWRIFRIQI
jgi:hypothetical protein